MKYFGMNWEDSRKINKILDKNIQEIPYEGAEIDKEAIAQEFGELLDQNYNYALEDIKREFKNLLLNLKK